MSAGRTLIVLVLLLSATSAGAGHFTVTLDNGRTLDTRYEPVEAEWDPGVTLLLTDRGNWTALETPRIVEVTPKDEETGFGYRLDTTPRFLGWILIEVDDEEDVGDARSYELPEAPEGPEQSYSIEPFITIQGIDPTDAPGGIPLDLFADGFYDFYPFGE